MNMKKKFFLLCLSFALLTTATGACSTGHHHSSVKPGINREFENPDIKEYVSRFERPGRPVFDKRNEIVSYLDLKPGMAVADIGAGTGFFTFLISEKVGAEGKVYAVDISKNFIDYIQSKAQKDGIKNVSGIVNSDKSTGLAPNSVDAVLIVDSYHHFEYPKPMLASIREALKPDGTLLIVDFERIEGQTEDWILKMVRAGKGHFTDEIIDAGFKLITEETTFAADHYILRFKKRDKKKADQISTNK